jgi:hypothetical protein
MTVVSGGFGSNRFAVCLPTPLARNAAGDVACQVFFALSAGDTCSAHAGLSDADPLVASAVLRESQTLSPSLPICVVPQLPGPCATSSQLGWCYDDTSPTAGCAHSIALSPSAAPPPNTLVAIACP